MRGSVSAKEALIHYLGAELCATSLRWTCHWKMAVANFLDTFEHCLRLDDFYNAQWICALRVVIFWYKFSSEIWEM